MASSRPSVVHAATRVAPLIGLLALAAGCGADRPTGPGEPGTPGGAVVATVEVTPAADTLLALDATVQLEAVARDSAGAVISDVNPTWTSSDPDAIAVAASTGVATAVGVGEATVTATIDGVGGDAELVVEQALSSIQVAPAEWAPEWAGARVRFTATGLDANAHEIGDAEVQWTMVDTDVAVIDTAGVATAKSAGATQLLASRDGVQGTAAVSVMTGPETPPDGLLYTIWFARSDSIPMVLYDHGALYAPPNIFYDEPLRDAYPAEFWEPENVAKFEWAGDRVGLLTDVVGGQGNFRVRDRVGEWVELMSSRASDFQLEGNRIAVLTNEGALLAKDGTFAAWTNLVSSGVVDFQLEGDRIAVLLSNGELRAKDGLNGSWGVLVAAGGDVAQFQLQGVRIGVLFADGTLLAKDGINSPSWTELASAGANRFDLSAERIAVRFDDGRLLAKDGLNASWTELFAVGGDVADFALEGNRIGVLEGDGSFRVKDGLAGSWEVLANGGVDRFQLQGDHIGILSTSGLLSIKRGIMGGWEDAQLSGGAVKQFRLIVDLPMPPARTTPASYASRQAACSTDPDCISPWEFGTVISGGTPFYGMFCGDDRPTTGWDAARARIIDAFDELCMHHDAAGVNGRNWYPEAGGFQSCVVKYGIYYGRLTRDGDVLASGASSQSDWDAAWGSAMPNLKGALEAYFDYTSGCDELVRLPNFVEATASEN